MRKLTAILLATTALVACGKKDNTAPGSSAQQTAAATPEEIDAETARLNKWFEDRYQEQLDFSPINKTFLGLKDDYDKIDDVSEKAGDEQLAWTLATVEDLKKNFDYNKLTPEAKTSYDIWVYQAERAKAAQEFQRMQYVFTQMDGPQVFFPQFLIVFHKVDEPSDMDAYVARIGGVAHAVDQLVERAKVGAGEGVRPPKFAYDAVIEQARGVVTGAPFGGEGEAPLWADAKAKIDALEKAGKIDKARGEALREAARKALVERIKPSYEALTARATQDVKNADVEATGVGKLARGRDFYNERLANSTTTDLTADEVHQIGLNEVARIHKEMEAIKDKVGFKGTLQEFFVYTREDPQVFYPDTDAGRETYLQTARDRIAVMKTKIPNYFGILPKADLEVRRVEPFREQPGAAQHYFAGAPDGSRPGIYYVHLADMKALPTHRLEAVAYHEGIPGHHMQISIAQELTGVPEFRTQAGFTAYQEGWGLYSEQLAKEMGGYEDPYSDFGRLSAEIWRSIRLVLDTGLHSKGWTEKQANEYALANSAQAPSSVKSEVRRFLVIPGQATAYKIGMLKIVELREKAQTELGGKFDIKGFHDTVLGGGALPLAILERRVDEWIAAKKA